MSETVLIDGVWRAGGGAPLTITDPARAEVLHQLPGASPADVDDACRSAAASFETWRDVSAAERAQVLSRVAERLRSERDAASRRSSLINGKPLSEAVLDIDDAAACFDYYAGLAGEMDGRREVTPRPRPDTWPSCSAPRRGRRR